LEWEPTKDYTPISKDYRLYNLMGLNIEMRYAMREHLRNYIEIIQKIWYLYQIMGGLFHQLNRLYKKILLQYYSKRFGTTIYHSRKYVSIIYYT